MNNTPFPLKPFSVDPKKEIENFIKWQESINRENLKALRKIFKEEIKETFLINILNKVKAEHNDILKYYPNALNLNPVEMMQGADDRVDFDICCHIVGIHKFNMLFLDDIKKGEFQKDLKYQNKLVDQVYEHVKLRQYGSSYFRNRPIMKGDRFLFFPIGYDMFVITSYLFELLDEEVVQENPYFYFYQSMLAESISILTLIENGLLLQAYPQARNLIELYFKYEVLFDKPDALNEYYKFCDYEIEYNERNILNKDFNDKYKTHKKEVDMIDYLHFGWIDKIFDFEYLLKEKKYSIPGLYNYLKLIHKNDANFDGLKNLHNICHAFSHGSTITKAYPIHSFFELMPILFNILRAILIDICNVVKHNPIIDGIDIKRKVELDWKTFNEKTKLLTIDNIKKYYAIK